MKPLIYLTLYFCAVTLTTSAQNAQANLTKRYVIPLSPNPFRFTTKMVMVRIAPSWGPSSEAVNKKKSVFLDSVFRFLKKSKNRDSILSMVQLFDSSGNLVERQQYSWKDGSLQMLDVLVYEEGVLFRKEEFDATSNRKDVTTYDYDSVGHLVVEKIYSNFNDSLKGTTITMKNREYDELGHLTKEFISLPNGKSFLEHEFFYNNNGKISEAKTFDISGHWKLSYFYEYDESNRSESIYKQFADGEKKIDNDYIYDDQNKLIEIKNYTEGETYAKRYTQTFFYTRDGLIDKQVYEDTERNDYYYKHYYLYFR
jgi:hypothetical protein